MDLRARAALEATQRPAAKRTKPVGSGTASDAAPPAIPTRSTDPVSHSTGSSASLERIDVGASAVEVAATRSGIGPTLRWRPADPSGDRAFAAHQGDGQDHQHDDEGGAHAIILVEPFGTRTGDLVRATIATRAQAPAGRSASRRNRRSPPAGWRSAPHRRACARPLHQAKPSRERAVCRRAR